jgi:hypothetical protein
MVMTEVDFVERAHFLHAAEEVDFRIRLQSLATTEAEAGADLVTEEASATAAAAAVG